MDSMVIDHSKNNDSTSTDKPKKGNIRGKNAYFSSNPFDGDTLSVILSFVDLESLLVYRLVCKEWDNTIMNSRYIWETKNIRFYKSNPSNVPKKFFHLFQVIESELNPESILYLPMCVNIRSLIAWINVEHSRAGLQTISNLTSL